MRTGAGTREQTTFHVREERKVHRPNNSLSYAFPDESSLISAQALMDHGMESWIEWKRLGKVFPHA